MASIDQPHLAVHVQYSVDAYMHRRQLDKQRSDHRTPLALNRASLVRYHIFLVGSFSIVRWLIFPYLRVSRITELPINSR